MMELKNKFLISLFLLAILNIAIADKKHVRNKTKDEFDPDVTKLLRPFRMSKINFVWLKAQNLLPESKLKSLFWELKVQDKNEINWKSQGAQKDKTGRGKEELRSKLGNIMKTYGLYQYFDDSQDQETTKSYTGNRKQVTFEDKSLNNLWEKAQTSDFTPEELSSLTVQLIHHQDEIDMFNTLMAKYEKSKKSSKNYENSIDEKHEDLNMILTDDDNDATSDNAKKYNNEMNRLREQNRYIKQHFTRLERLVTTGVTKLEFIEPQAQKLWERSQSSGLPQKDLEIIKYDLYELQSRLLKLRHLQAEEEIQYARYRREKQHHKSDIMDDIHDNIAKQKRKLGIIQESIVQRISKHEEL